MKTCRRCNTAKAEAEFYRRETGALRGECKACVNARSNEWRRGNPEKRAATIARGRAKRPRIFKNSYLKHRYGITLDQFEAMRDAQGGACLICEVVPDDTLHVDHCHTTLKIRGLLCGHCNRMLGCARDLPETLLRGAEYLRSSQSRA